MSSLTNEQRREKRRSKRVDARLQFRSQPAQWASVSLDLSKGGARFTADRPVERGEPVLLTVQLHHPETSIECKGKVSWARRTVGDNYRFGVRFIDLNEDEKATLERYLADNGDSVTYARS